MGLHFRPSNSNASSVARPSSVSANVASPRLIRPFIIISSIVRCVIPAFAGSIRLATHFRLRSRGRPSMPPGHPIKHCGRRIQINGFSTPNPSHRQAVPCCFILCGTREFGHSPTFGGKPPEFFTAVHCAILPASDLSHPIARRQIAACAKLRQPAR